MFQEKAIMFLYCVSPVHMGAGTALGAIDNPIQRERHTNHPMMVGSGIKGALRHHLSTAWKNGDVERIFGPDKEGSEHAGAVSFADAQIVLFPVRSLRNSYVYATSRTALARLKRLLEIAKPKTCDWNIPQAIGDDECVVLDDERKASDGRVVLESYQFAVRNDGSKESVRSIAQWLSQNSIPENSGMEYFRSKIGSDTVLLSDNRFNYFVKHATVVEPHVRISDETGTAEEGGLFYTENLPPESLLASLVMVSPERTKKGDSDGGRLEANIILEQKLMKDLNGMMVQMGGDSTTGRGQVVLKFFRQAAKEENR